MSMNMEVNMHTHDNDMPSSVGNSVYFSPWSEFQMHLLFMGWDIKQPWQLALTWFFVVIAVVLFNYIEFVNLCMRQYMKKTLLKLEQNATTTVEGTYIKKPVRPSGWAILKIFYGTLTSIQYCLGLFFMLISMSFSPTLFLALFFGYAIGQYLVCDATIDIDTHVKVLLAEPQGSMGKFLNIFLRI